jgi:hypothetical protein
LALTWTFGTQGMKGYVSHMGYAIALKT